MRNAETSPAGWIPFMRSLARDAGLKVIIGGSPATDGKTMWLPALPAELTPDDLVVFKGNGYHEVGHIQRSNIVYFQAFGKEHGSFAGFLLNALDDVFMEGRQAAWKRTAGRYLLDSTEVLIKRNQFRDGSAGIGEALACYCLAYLTTKRWPTIGTAAARIEGNLRKHLAQYADIVIPAVRNLLDTEFPHVASTEDCGAVALKIIDLLKSLAEQDQVQPTSSEETREGGEDGEGSSSPDPAPSENSDAPGESHGVGEEEQAEQDGDGHGSGNVSDSELDSKGEGAEEHSVEKAGSNGEQGGMSGSSEGEEGLDGESQTGSAPLADTDKPLAQLVNEMLKEKLGNQEVFDKGAAVEELAKGIASGANEAYKGRPLIDGLEFDYSSGAGKAVGFVDGMPVVEADRKMATAIDEVTGRKANVMGNRLRALLSNREETEEFIARNGRLCERNLHRFALNDSRLFAKADDRVEDTAAVSITADLSASTGFGGAGAVAEQIRIALTIIEKVLHQIGTPREILGFAPRSGEKNCMVKSFEDNHRVALDRIAGLHKLVGGVSTPIGAAVMQAGARLVCHEAQRKLLLVVTDGAPDDESQALDMTRTVLRSGVDVIYLVIGDELSCKWLKEASIKFAYAKNAEGIIPSMIKKMAEFLK